MQPIAAFILFMLTVPAANWLIGNVGTVCISNGPCLIPVGFNLMAPSGVLMIGLALVLRDWLHEVAGRWTVMAAIVLGATLSLIVAPPAIATASAVAFLIAELADFAVYSPLRNRQLALAVLFSGMVGAFVDSAIFVYLAFGSFDLSLGTTLAKIYASAIAAAALTAWKQYRLA